MRRPGSVLLFLALVILRAPLSAQTVDTAIVGTVADSTGAVISGATVTVSSPTTGIEKNGSAGPEVHCLTRHAITEAKHASLGARSITFKQK